MSRGSFPGGFRKRAAVRVEGDEPWRLPPVCGKEWTRSERQARRPKKLWRSPEVSPIYTLGLTSGVFPRLVPLKSGCVWGWGCGSGCLLTLKKWVF